MLSHRELCYLVIDYHTDGVILLGGSYDQASSVYLYIYMPILNMFDIIVMNIFNNVFVINLIVHYYFIN